MAQILYPKYMFFIALYSIVFFLIIITSAKYIDKMFGNFYDEKNKKSRIVLWIEVIIQVPLVIVFSYIVREIVDYFFRNTLSLDKFIYGNPDKFAVTILAPVMFFSQRNLRRKITYLWNLEKN